MTKRGIILLILLAPMVFAAFAFSSREIFVLSCTIILMLLFSVVSVLFAAFSLKRNESLLSDLTVRNEPVFYKITLNGTVFLPVVVEIRILPLGKVNIKKNYLRNVLYTILGKCYNTLDFEIKCPNTGIWYFEQTKFYIRDIFGFISIPSFDNSKHKKAHELLVFPRILTINLTQQYIPVNSGDSQAGKIVASAGDNFSGTRSYNYGDQLKRVHWKQTVRTREIHVRKYENNIDPNVLIILDSACFTKNTYEYANIATESVSSIIDYYINNNQSVRLLILHTDSDDTKKLIELSATKNEGFNDIYNMLAVISFKQNEDSFDLLQLENSFFEQVKKIHIITDNPSEQLVYALSDYSDIGYSIKLIVPACDDLKSLEFNYSKNFSEGLSSVIVSDPDQIGVSWGNWL